MTVAGLLWLSAETPDVNGGGGQRRQFHHIRTLVESGIDVAVATLAGPQSDSTIRSLATVHRFGPRRLRRRNRDLERVIEAVAPKRAIVAHVESVPHIIPELKRERIPFLVDFHNVVSRWHASSGRAREAAAWRARERNALAAANRATACSIEERAALLALRTHTPIDLSPQGVDPEEWPASYLCEQRDSALALSGSWNHEPNRLAAEWLVHDVWPLMRTALPDARLLLLGPGRPPAAVLEQDGVEAPGRVASLAEALGRVRVAVVPIRRGIGTRVKFVESLASGAAVVSTTLGSEGFEAEGTFVCADEPEEFASACVELLCDAERAATLGHRGRELAFARYRWTQVSESITLFAQGR